MFIQRLFFWAAFCCLSLLLAVPGFAASSQPAEAARVIAVTPGAFVQRGNARAPLKLKDPLYKEDQVSTDATGKLQLLFADDTTVAVAPDSMVNIADFSFGGPAKASFAMGVGRGLARVVTGKVVEQNREGFKVTTPHATVGIRGTILTADVRSPSQSKFILSQLGAGHTVSVFNTATGQNTEMPKAGLTTEAGAAGNVLRLATPAEMNAVQTVTRQTRQAPQTVATGNSAARGTSTAARPQAQSSTTAKNPATTGTPASMGASGVEDPSGGHSVAGKGDTTVNQVAATAPKSNEETLHGVGNLADSSAPDGSSPDPTPGGDLTPDPMPGGDLTPGAGDNPGGLSASYVGGLGSRSAEDLHGGFSFDVNLGSGVLDKGTMYVEHSGTRYEGTDGSGQLTGSDFTLGFEHMTETGNLPEDRNVTGNIAGSLSPDKESLTVDQWEVNTQQHGVSIGGDTGCGHKAH